MSLVIETCDMHTAGEPLRIITKITPELAFPSESSLDEKIELLRSELDHVRRMVIQEPRGHHDMYAALLQPPDNHKEADISVIFMHNQGYSTMCGHATIALGRFLLDKRIVEGQLDQCNNNQSSPTRLIRLQCPCGVVEVRVDQSVDENEAPSVRFRSVPAFAAGINLQLPVLLNGNQNQLEAQNLVTFDIGYGGAFYAIVSDRQLHLKLKSSSLAQIVEAATQLKHTIISDRKLFEFYIRHPNGPTAYNFLYGVIVTDDADDADMTGNVCVFADRQVDRSPTGSGVTARVAVQYAKQQIQLGQVKTYQNSLFGVTSSFTGGPVRIFDQESTQHTMVVVEVSGKAYYTGQHIFSVEKSDPFGYGFKIQ